MANFSQNNHQTVFVGKDVAAEDTTKTIAALNDGEVKLFTPGGVRVIETGGSAAGNEVVAAAGDVFGIYLGRAAALGPLRTPFFSKADVTSVSRKEYVAPTEQLDYIGSNGTSGSIEVNNNTVYRATIELDKGRPNTNLGGVYVKDMVFESDANATQSEIALGLAASGFANMSREAEQSIRFAAINDEAGVPLGTGAGDVTFVAGSKVTQWGDVTDATINAAPVVGDYLRAGTAVTADTYKIVAIDTAAHTVTLDAPYRGSTATLLNAAVELIPSASGLAAEWGVSLAAQTLAWSNGQIEDAQVQFDVSLDADSFGATPLVNSVVSTPGTGTYRQVAELEWFANGNNGDIFRNEVRNGFPFTGNAVAGETYDVIEIALERGRKDSLGYVNSPQVISLFIDAGKNTSGHYALAATADDITDVLEDLLEGVPVYGGAVTANGGALAAGDLDLG
jgi:hypothetical protein